MIKAGAAVVQALIVSEAVAQVPRGGVDMCATLG